MVRNETWYVALLARGDVTMYEKVFRSRYMDAITQLSMLLRNSGG